MAAPDRPRCAVDRNAALANRQRPGPRSLAPAAGRDAALAEPARAPPRVSRVRAAALERAAPRVDSADRGRVGARELAFPSRAQAVRAALPGERCTVQDACSDV